MTTSFETAEGIAKIEVSHPDIQVLLVDDHPIFLEGAAGILSSAEGLNMVGRATDVEGAQEVIENHKNVVVVLDFMLKHGNSLRAVRNWSRVNTDVRCLMISMLCDPVSVEQALLAGAKGYVTKQEAAEQLIHAIRAVAAGEVYLSPVAEKALEHWKSTRGGDETKLARDGGRLTRREHQILSFIGEGKETREIAEALGVSRKTVETHKENMKRKLHCPSQTALARLAAIWTMSRAGLPDA